MEQYMFSLYTFDQRTQFLYTVVLQQQIYLNCKNKNQSKEYTIPNL